MLAKIRTRPPDAATQEKLRALVAQGDHEVLKHAAWPLDYLVDTATDSVVGVVMPNLANMAPLAELSIPKSRLKSFPAERWDFLLLVARNLAAAFDEVHNRGFVKIGRAHV